MANDQESEGFDLSKALVSLKSINLRGGIFGKTTTLLVTLSICVTTACVYSSAWWMPLVLICPLMIMVSYALKRCFDFAEKHPQAAIMEGAEFLVHERMLFAQKNQVVDPKELPTVADHQPLEIEMGEVIKPDPLPGQTLPDVSEKREDK